MVRVGGQGLIIDFGDIPGPSSGSGPPPEWMVRVGGQGLIIDFGDIPGVVDP